MFNGLKNVFKTKDLRNRIILTVVILVLYRIGCYIALPGIPVADLSTRFNEQLGYMPAFALLNLFSGNALARMSVFCLGIMPYITAQIIMQMLQAVVPSLETLSKEGESGQRKITQYTRYITIALAFLNAIGYYFLFQNSYGISFSNVDGVPSWIYPTLIIGSMLVGAMIIMWFGEIITQKGVGNGMSLIIFANIISGLPQAFITSFQNEASANLTWIILAVVLVVLPFIIFIERGQRRIPIQFAKRVQGRRLMGGEATYLPIKVNTAGVIPIIFASAVLYFPAQISAFFPDVEWLKNVANALSAGWINWVLEAIMIVAFAYFYTSMVFKPDETSDQLRKQGGFIPGVRPGAATERYIKQILNRITLPGSIFLAVLAIVPSIVAYYCTGGSSLTGSAGANNDLASAAQLIRVFGGTSILIMVGVALDTMMQVQGHLKAHDFKNLFIK